MLSAKRVSYLAAAMILGMSQSALAAQAKEEDSAYQWGRWAVLSPAAGGAEPYVAVDAPGAEYNARPGDASEFQPEIASFETPPVQPPVVPPGVGDVNPGIPVVTQPPTLPTFPVPPGVGDINTTVPVVTAPPTLPVFGGTN